MTVIAEITTACQYSGIHKQFRRLEAGFLRFRQSYAAQKKAKAMSYLPNLQRNL